MLQCYHGYRYPAGVTCYSVTMVTGDRLRILLFTASLTIVRLKKCIKN